MRLSIIIFLLMAPFSACSDGFSPFSVSADGGTTDTPQPPPEPRCLEPELIGPQLSLGSWQSSGDFESIVFGERWTLAPLIPTPLCAEIELSECEREWRLEAFFVDTVDGTVAFDRDDVVASSGERELCVAGPPVEALTGTYALSLTHKPSGATVRVPFESTLAEPSEVGFDALSLTVDGTGGLWMGTVRNGLVGINGAEVSHFPGVSLSADFDPDFNGPQAPALPTILHDPATADASGNAGLWVGSFITGISRLDLTTGQWRHYNLNPGSAFSNSPVGPIELAQTALALVDDGDAGLWVGSANGLYHMSLSDDEQVATFARAADGVITAMAGRRMDAGRPQELWLGHTTQATPSAEDAPFWPKQNVNLTVVSPDLEDPAMATEFDLSVPGDVVLALHVDETQAFVGSDAGLFRVALESGSGVSPDAALEAVPLPTTESRPIVTALAGDGEGGVWIGVVYECAVDAGALFHRASDGTVTEYSQAVDGDVSAITRLDDGTLAVSTHTMSRLVGAALTSCKDVAQPHRGDVYLVDPASPGGPWERLR